MYARTGPIVYLVWWPQERIFKVGYSEHQRWRIFTLRGAELVQLRDFGSALDAARFETDCHHALRKVCRRGFQGRTEAVPLLGCAGAGWMECFAIPGDLMAHELPDFCDAALDILRKGGA